MTRKQALQLALRVINDEEATAKIQEIINEMPLVRWTKATIFDSIDQFIIDNGRIPTITDFKKFGLPPHTVIKNRFGITLKEFLIKYYPQKCNSKIYYNKTKEEWLENFKTQYEKIKPTNMEMYDKLRDPNTPSWQTVAKLFNIKNWLDLLDFCFLEKYYSKRTIKRNSTIFNVKSHSDLFD